MDTKGLDTVLQSVSDEAAAFAIQCRGLSQALTLGQVDKALDQLGEMLIPIGHILSVGPAGIAVAIICASERDAAQGKNGGLVGDNAALKAEVARLTAENAALVKARDAKQESEILREGGQ